LSEWAIAGVWAGPFFHSKSEFPNCLGLVKCKNQTSYSSKFAKLCSMVD
jgi:hypothetical protein